MKLTNQAGDIAPLRFMRNSFKAVKPETNSVEFYGGLHRTSKDPTEVCSGKI